MLKFKDSGYKPRGDFTLRVLRHGKVEEIIEEKNLVVDLANTTLAHLIGGDVTNRSVTQIAFGTNGTAPAGGNTSMTDPFTKDVDVVSYPAAGQVQFDFSLLTSEANGKAIAEFGLLTEGGTLFARKHRSAGALIKDSDLSLEGSWLITF
jgi:hypothetical protein